MTCLAADHHDQGAIPLKLHAFETGVNITLGIPFVRTSRKTAAPASSPTERGACISSSTQHRELPD